MSAPYLGSIDNLLNYKEITWLLSAQTIVWLVHSTLLAKVDYLIILAHAIAGRVHSTL